MKKIINIIFFILICGVYIYAQQNDTAIHKPDNISLIKGTKVAVVDGHKNIETLKQGDNIEAIELDGESGSYTPKATITKMHKTVHKKMLRLTLENDMQIVVTADLPFYTADGWASFDPEKTKLYDRYKNSTIIKYEIGTEFYADPENPSKLKSIEEISGKFETYSLELDCPDCWYIANGFLVGQE